MLGSYTCRGVEPPEPAASWLTSEWPISDYESISFYRDLSARDSSRRGASTRHFERFERGTWEDFSISFQKRKEIRPAEREPRFRGYPRMYEYS
jgi:hypothetical protein